MSLSFKPISDGLYIAVDETSQTVALYWLLLAGNPPAGNLGVSDTFDNQAYVGAFLFLPADAKIADPKTFAESLKGVFTPTTNNPRWVSWISDPLKPVDSQVTRIVAVYDVNSSSAQVNSKVSAPFSNVTLEIPSPSTMTLDVSAPAAPFLKIKSPQATPIDLMRGTTGYNLSALDNTVNIPLTGSAVGLFSFDSDGWDRGSFYRLFYENSSDQFADTFAGNEVRYYHGSNAESPDCVRYPVFPPEAQQQGTKTKQLALNITLDPLYVWDGTRTRFGVDVETCKAKGYDVPESEYFFGTNGQKMKLTPQQKVAGAGGYAFGKRPKGDSSDTVDEFCYLTPHGKFDATVVDGGIGNFLCGLTGTEFLMVAPTATVEFANQQPAYAKQFSAPSGGSGSNGSQVDPCGKLPNDGGTPIDDSTPLLEETWTTSWLQINPPTTIPPQPIHYGYAIQPEAAVYYSSVTKKGGGEDYPYPMALGCRVSQLNSDTAPTLVPMVAYGGLKEVASGVTQPATSVFTAFENQIVASTRYHTAPKDWVNGPTFFDPVSHKPGSGKARTPEGLLVELNDNQGTWKTLYLAISPDIADTDPPPVPGASRLAFDGGGTPPVIDPKLSNALMNDKLFMVVTNPEYLGNQASKLDETSTPTKTEFDQAVTDVMNGVAGAKLPPGKWFENEIQMGEWTFRLDVDGPVLPVSTPTDPQDLNTTLIFKFMPGLSVIDLVTNAAYWQYWKDFIKSGDPKLKQGTPADVKNVQQALCQMFCVANPKGDHYGGKVFENFWSKVTDPNWTGILAMNCGLDAAELPIDLQQLLGGIDGELRAHHFGVTINQIQASSGGKITPSAQWKIDKSSMFALVHYQADYEPYKPARPDDDKFQVLKLNALFENSVLTHFDSKIAMTIPKLFDQPVTLTNTAVKDANVIEIDGTYQKHGDTGVVIFETKDPFVFTFNGTSTMHRVLDEVYVTDAALVPVSSTKDTACDGTTKPETIAVKSNFALSGQLVFSQPVQPSKPTDPALPDPFSYGDKTASPVTGLPFIAYNIAMCTEIANNVGDIKKCEPDRSAFRVQPSGATTRPSSLVRSLPIKLQRFVEYGSDLPAGWPVQGTAFSTDAFAPVFALQFQVSLGSLGTLSAVADSLEVDLILGWKPGVGTASDTVWLLMVPPKNMLGHEGFGIEGVLATTFHPVRLVQGFWPSDQTKQPYQIEYAIYLENVQVEILSMSLIPGQEDEKTGEKTTQAQFTIFTKPGGDGSLSNLGWLATYEKKKEDSDDG